MRVGPPGRAVEPRAEAESAWEPRTSEDATLSPPAAPPSDAVDGSSGGIGSALIIGPVLGGVALLALAVTAALVCRGSASRARARSTGTAPAAAPVKPVATALDAPSL